MLKCNILYRCMTKEKKAKENNQKQNELNRFRKNKKWIYILLRKLLRWNSNIARTNKVSFEFGVLFAHLSICNTRF